MSQERSVKKQFLIFEMGFLAVSRIMATIAAYFLGAIMLLTVADVFGRYFFNRPINGAYEIMGLMLVCAASWGMAYCQILKRNIKVDFLLVRFSNRIQFFISVFANIIGFCVFVLIIWQIIVMINKYNALPPGGNVTVTLGIPLIPFFIVLAVGIGMLILAFCIDFIRVFIKED